jgi:phage recombination protein Bet
VDHVAILRSAGRFPSDATAEEIEFGLEVAQRSGLDPWLGQVKFLRFESGDKIHAFVGIDGMRALAERNGKYDGREIEVELAKGPDGSESPVRALCRVYRKDWSRPLVEEVRFVEAVRRGRDGQPTRPWIEMPITMLRKAAEERALRAAFPVQLSGVYGEEEAPVGASR